jgi:hypothetical protein
VQALGVTREDDKDCNARIHGRDWSGSTQHAGRIDH